MRLLRTDGGMALMKASDGYIQTPIVSVIVPVYNTEDFLEECLNSLRNQSLTDIEIIIIDDGSTDNSGSICDLYANIDSRFIVKHKSNEGLSAARNDGLDLARAEYIMFVDSDDWVEPDFCEIPYNYAVKYEADVVVFQYARHGKRIVNHQKHFPIEGFLPDETVLTQLWQYVEGFAWNKIYRKKIFEGEIRYPVGRLCEDIAVTHRLIHHAKRVFLLNNCLYHHRCYRPGSITTDRSKEFISDGLYYNLQRLEDLKEWGYDCQAEEERIALWYLATMGRGAEYSIRSEGIIRNSENFVKNQISRKYIIMYYIYKASPKLFDLIAIVTGKRVKEE